VGRLEFVFEDLPEDFSFNNGEITWGELKIRLRERFSDAVLAKLEAQGIKRIEIGSIQWFHQRGKTRGRWVDLTTMHLARLLKR